jgi:5-aminopentanamidase
MEKNLRVALAQLSIIDGNKRENLNKVEIALQEASKESADILLLPELNLSGLVSKEQMKIIAEPLKGESYELIQKMVMAYQVALLYSFPEYVSEEEIYITSCLMDINGQILTSYRKTHLFSEENQIFSQGDRLNKVNFGGFSVGLLTCYDIEFPEPARTLALEGVNLLIVNSANMEPYEYIHRLFIRARALENQCFVVYSNRIGKNEIFHYHGQSAVIGPDGKVIAEIEKDVEAVKIVDISSEALKKSTSLFNYKADRRPNLYKRE